MSADGKYWQSAKSLGQQAKWVSRQRSNVLIAVGLTFPPPPPSPLPAVHGLTTVAWELFFLVHIFICDIYLRSFIKLMVAIFPNYTACRELQDKCNVRKVGSLIGVNGFLYLSVSDAKLASVLANRYAHGWTSGNCWSVSSFYDVITEVPAFRLIYRCC